MYHLFFYIIISKEWIKLSNKHDELEDAVKDFFNQCDKKISENQLKDLTRNLQNKIEEAGKNFADEVRQEFGNDQFITEAIKNMEQREELKQMVKDHFSQLARVQTNFAVVVTMMMLIKKGVFTEQDLKDIVAVSNDMTQNLADYDKNYAQFIENINQNKEEKKDKKDKKKFWQIWK
jgi:hypothetical protein